MPCHRQDFVFTEVFLEMQCDRNSGGTRNLILRGNDLVKKVKRRIKNSDMLTIVAFLRKHTEVAALDLPYNELSDCGLYTFTTYLKEASHIKYLNLIGNYVGPRGIGYLLSLGTNMPLYCLRLSGNKFGDEGGKLISELLRTKTPLRFLDLSDTDQTITGLAYVMSALMPNRGGSETLEYIDISRPLPQIYHQVCNTNVAEFVSQIIQVNKYLKEIHVQQHRFDFRDMEILLDGLFANTTLLCLDLNNNNIGDDGVEFLCSYLRTSPQLECLMIGANNFGDIGATVLGYNLPYSKIKLLDITNNRIGDEGMINIFSTIRKKVKMSGLFIWGNKLTHTSLVYLQRLFLTKLLDPEHIDVKLYSVDKKLHASWNPQANRYTHRFYCVSDYGFPPIRKPLLIPPPPLEKPPIYYRHHVDATKMGLPLGDWSESANDSDV